MPIIVGRANLLDTGLTMWNADLIGENEWERFERLICREHERALEIAIDQIILSASTADYRDFIVANC